MLYEVITIEFGSMNSTITNNYKSLSFWGNISNEEKSKSGITTGVGVEYILSDHFYLQSGLNFSLLESGTTIYNTDETSANWQEVPRRYDSETEYRIVSLPIGLRYNFLQLKNLKAYMSTGIQFNSVLDYKSTTIETYYDSSTKYYDTGFEKDEFSLVNFSAFASLGVDYELSKRFWIGISGFYSNMLNAIKGRETFNGNRYTIKIDDLGAKIKIGYKF